MNPIKTKLFATAIATVAMAPMALANSQLDESLINEMNTLGVEVSSYEYLTPSDAAEIKNIVSSDMTQNRKALEIEQIVDTSMTEQGVDVMIVTPESSLRNLVKADLTAMGVDVDVDALPLSEVAEIKAILSSDLSTNDQKDRVMAIVEG